jgi:tripartite-type tricarboxylate transporter receptor subunit TctC
MFCFANSTSKTESPMKFSRRNLLRIAANAAMVPIASQMTKAQSYPDRSVRLAVPFAPGGSADPVARVLANRLTEIWGQLVVVENIPGDSGNIAAQAVSRSAPDGYTLFIGGRSLTTNPFVYSSGVDPITELTPVTRLCTFTNVMIVSNSSPMMSVREFIDYAKTDKRQTTFASSGTGASPHLTGEMFRRLAGLEMTHMPYRSVDLALGALMDGQVDVMFATLPSVLARIQRKTVRPLGATSATRSPFVPDLPTIVESGVSGVEVSDGYGLFLPPRAPTELMRKIHDDTVAALAHPPVRRSLEEIAATSVTSTPSELVALLKSELDRWGPIVKELGIKPN